MVDFKGFLRVTNFYKFNGPRLPFALFSYMHLENVKAIARLVRKGAKRQDLVLPQGK